MARRLEGTVSRTNDNHLKRLKSALTSHWKAASLLLKQHQGALPTCHSSCTTHKLQTCSFMEKTPSHAAETPTEGTCFWVCLSIRVHKAIVLRSCDFTKMTFVQTNSASDSVDIPNPPSLSNLLWAFCETQPSIISTTILSAAWVAKGGRQLGLRCAHWLCHIYGRCRSLKIAR